MASIRWSEIGLILFWAFPNIYFFDTIIGIVDIKSLRDFQMLDYGLQVDNGKFKPTPPGVDPNNVIDKKRKNKLIESFEK